MDGIKDLLVSVEYLDRTGALGMLGAPLLWAESGIPASVFVLGAAVAIAKRPPLMASMALVSLFGIFHGYAHGGEMAPLASPYSYGLGFAVGTFLLHSIGVSASTLFMRGGNRGARLLRVGGAAIAAYGVAILVQL